MAYEISDLDGVVIAPGGSYQFGSIKDKPGGTRVNRKMLSDLMQMSQRMMANAGISPNGNPDNDTNGYQLVEALVKIGMRGLHGMAEAFGAGTSSTVPIRLSGLQGSIGGGNLNVTAGWGMWWGKVFYYAGGSTPYVNTQKFTINTTADGFPQAVLSTVMSVTPSATEFEWVNLIDWSEAVGIDGLLTDVTALQTALTTNSWSTLGTGIGWSAGSTPPPEVCKDGRKTYLRGVMSSSSSSPAVLVSNLAVGFRPSIDIQKPCSLYHGSGTTFSTVNIAVTTTGDILFIDTTQVPTGTGWSLHLDFDFMR